MTAAKGKIEYRVQCRPKGSRDRWEITGDGIKQSLEGAQASLARYLATRDWADQYEYRIVWREISPWRAV